MAAIFPSTDWGIPEQYGNYRFDPARGYYVPETGASPATIFASPGDGGGTTGGTTTTTGGTTTTTDPFAGLGAYLNRGYRNISATAYPSFQMPYITQMLTEAQRLYGQGGVKAYPGSTVAPLSNLEEWAITEMQKRATGQLSETADLASLMQKMAYQLPSTISTNPELAAAVKAAINPVMQQLTEQALPYVRAGAQAHGATGGTRQSLAEALSVERLGKQAMDVSAGMYGNAWQNAWNTYMQALGMTPEIQAAQLAPATTLGAAGAMQRSVEQAKLEEDAAKYYYEQYMPYMALTEYANLIRQPYGEVGVGAQEIPEVGTAQTVAGLGIAALPYILKYVFGMGG